MNHKLVAKVLGFILCVESAFLLLPLGVGLLYHDGTSRAFLATIGICLVCGVPLARMDTEGARMQSRDGFACVGLSWIVMGAAGALPYVFSGAIPHYVDALFETISGFTTTGASILSEIESLPKGVLFWRALTQWMGGMGVLVLLLALLPRVGDGSVNLMRAESPGPTLTKLVPKVADTAKILYCIYIGLTVLEIICLVLAGMPLLDAVTNSFTTISTGGFCIRNASIAFYQSALIDWIIIVFMFLSGINFSLLFLFLTRRVKQALASEELRLYTLLTLGASALITLELTLRSVLPLGEAIHQSVFQVVSLITTTGYGTADFALWPYTSQCIILLIMLCGACAGSTAGGLKDVRILVLLKNLRRWLVHVLHPREVTPVLVDRQRVEEQTVTNISGFFFTYMILLGVCTLIVSLDGIPVTDAFSAALTSLSNVGPGLGSLGPTANFGHLSDLSKLSMSFAMLLGRLEIVPLLILLFPSIWRKK